MLSEKSMNKKNDNKCIHVFHIHTMMYICLFVLHMPARVEVFRVHCVIVVSDVALASRQTTIPYSQ